MASASRVFVERHGIGPPESLCEALQERALKFVAGRCASHRMLPEPTAPRNRQRSSLRKDRSSRCLFLGKL